MVLKRMWMNKTDFVNLMNYLRKTTDSSLAQRQPQDKIRRFTWSNLIQSNIFIGLLCPIYLTMSAAYVNEQVLTPMNCFGIPLPWKNTDLTTKAQDVFGFGWLLSNYTNQTVIKLESLPVKSSEIWYGVLATIIEISAITRSVTRYFSSLFLLAGVLTFWNAICLNVSRLTTSYSNTDLKSDLNSDTDTTPDSNNTIVIVNYGRFISISIFDEDGPSLHNWECVYTIYKELRTLSHLINSAFGSIITVTMARAILFNSANVDHALYGQDFMKKILLLLLTVHDTAVFLLAADACNRMDGFKIWLSKDENRKTVPLDQLNVVLNEINTATVGIRGNNMFTITYSLLWSVVGTVVTYFIICVEARKNL
ncbi:hypothetical protein Ocin01_13561 [Orchesella cincta]|uniref:Gustatory receptor n=1 Tax=Orchesella cincta TaxID=48709 RepID=A0A1D2MJA6_ORCCI|nr:hypothetical protein Ocin01_13561 [Orchesella cincta]